MRLIPGKKPLCEKPSTDLLISWQASSPDMIFSEGKVGNITGSLLGKALSPALGPDSYVLQKENLHDLSPSFTTKQNAQSNADAFT